VLYSVSAVVAISFFTTDLPSYFSTMIRSLTFIFFLLGFYSKLYAQTDTAYFNQIDTSHLRISLLTCGTGLQPWETFGHSAIRVTDSVAGTDNVYNYGTFNGYDEDFLLNFTRGKLLYYLSLYPYRVFLQEYADADRSVVEQELILPGIAKQALYEYLSWNAREENRYYKYDFFFDNCATRIRDVFPRAMGRQFQLGKAQSDSSAITFREIINRYFYRVHWQRFGVNILLGSKIDRVMTNEEMMFLPDYLQNGISTSTYRGKLFTTSPETRVPAMDKAEAGINMPFVLMLVFLLLTVLGHLFANLRLLGNVMTFLTLFVSGFIGCFILIMWLGTDHQTCQNNYNLLWALPTNLVVAFASKRHKHKYALIGIVLIAVSLILHLLRIQVLPLFELAPYLAALLFVYGMIYRKNRLKVF